VKQLDLFDVPKDSQSDTLKVNYRMHDITISMDEAVQRCQMCIFFERGGYCKKYPINWKSCRIDLILACPYKRKY
jgi:hypothetical protein